MEITFKHLDLLLPYARNSRTHSAAQVGQIQASIIEWGWTNPVLADDDGIVAGHGRCAAARILYDAGRTLYMAGAGNTPIPPGCVPVIDCTGWTEAQRRAYVIADNQLPLNAGWDTEMLGVEIADLQAASFNIALLGFNGGELSDLIDAQGDDDGEPGDGPDKEGGNTTCPNCGHKF